MYPNLKLQMWKKGIRQNRMAKLLGVDEALLSKIVNGFRRPSSGLRSRIAELLGSDEQWLFAPMGRDGGATDENSDGAGYNGV